MSRYGYLFRKSTAYVSSLSLMLAPIGGPVAHAQNVLPQGGSVVGGSATISQPSASALSINQSSARAIINWNSFSVGAPNSVTFYQPNSSSAALNRVTGSTPSSIAGRLSANGQIFLVNPNGIAITPSGTVNVGGGFVASTLDIANGAFMAGNLFFRGTGASAGVSNQGIIRTAPGGFVGLLGGTVSNQGTILVPLGKVGLGSGEQATLDLYGDGLMQVAVPTNARTSNGQSLLEVAGSINAAGGKIEISAATVAQAIRNAVNVSGSLSASSVAGRDGAIALGGGPGGNVKITGSIDVSGSDSAGKILTTGANVELAGAKITAQSLQGMGGSIIITAANNVALSGSTLNASGGTGGGAIRIGGDFHGLGTIGTAATTVVDDKTTIKSDALLSGPGGTVVLWSGELTSFQGQISAKGGAQSGNGGTVEVSSKGVLDYRGVTDLSAVKGQTGTLLLDPDDYIIGAAEAATIAANLATANVIIQTTAGGVGGNGDITVNSLVNWASANSFTLSAYRHVAVNANIANTGGAAVVLYADNSGTGTGTVSFGGGTVSTTGAVSIFYNPSSYATPTNYAGNVIGSTPTAYMLVNDVNQLQAVNTNLAGTYALGRNIDASVTSGWNCTPTCAGFAPLVAASGGYPEPAPATMFTGMFDGQNYTISNLVINRPASDYASLFGMVGTGGTVKNVGLINPTVTGNFSIGALAGFSGGTIQNTFVTGGSVTGSVFVGGLVGWNRGTIEQSSYGGTVTGVASADVIGGLVGWNEATGVATPGIVTGSQFAGAVSGDNWVGGLVGYNGSHTAVTTSIINSSASGTVSGNQYVGGLVGWNNQSGVISGSFANVTVNGNIDVGGLVGINCGALDCGWLGAAGVVTQSYATGTVIGTSYHIGGLIGYDAGGLVTQSYATGDVSGYQAVGGLIGWNRAGTVMNSSASGDVNGNGYQGGLVGYNGYYDGTGTVQNSYATGTVTGSASAQYVGGLVGYNHSGTITQTYATGAASGSQYVGGLVGYNNSGTVSNSYATGNVTAINNWAGGLIGETRGNVTNSYATGNVSGTDRVGGLIGVIEVGFSVSQSYATGNVNGTFWVGGLAGVNAGAVTNSYATGNVTGTELVGGLVGYNWSGGAYPTTISNSYATGNVTGTSAIGAQSTGGLVGDNYNSLVTQSYATGNVSGEKDTGGLVGRNINGGQITQSYATGAVTGSTFYNPGGLVGYNEFSGSISYSYALGPVTLVTTARNPSEYPIPRWAGGLVGWNDGTIIQSYATGKVTADNPATQFPGGLVGAMRGSVSQSYWDQTTTGQTFGFGQYFSGTFGATALQSNNPADPNHAYNVSSYASWMFGTSPTGSGNNCSGFCWVIVDSKGTFNNVGGTGATRPFLLSEYSTSIVNPHEMQLASLNLGGSYTLAKNVDLAPVLTPDINGNYPNMWGPAGFVPIGNATGFPTASGTPFSGVFDGQNHTISNLVINRPAASGIGDYAGLFGYSTGSIKNVGLLNVNVTGGDHFVGGLVGYNSFGSIVQRSYVTGTVTGSSTGDSEVGYIGGLAGLNRGTISLSYGDVVVMGHNYVGGLVGSNHHLVSQSYAHGSVSGVDSVGGLVGYNWNGAGSGTTGTITQTYAAGHVTGTTRVGGLLGTIDGGSITQSYWDTTTTGQPSGLGGTVVPGTFLATGLNTAQMQNLTTATSMPQTTYIGWDFQNVWSPPNQGAPTSQGGNTVAHYPQLYGVNNNVVWVKTNDVSRVYGDANPAFTSNYYGLNSGDMLTTAFTLATSATPASNVGNYLITASPLSVTGTSGTIYRVVYTGTLTINQAALTFTANTASRAYGDANPPLSGSVIGFKLGQDAMTFGGATWTTTALATSNVGNYPINGGLTNPAPNYSFTQAAANAIALTINQRLITVTPTAGQFKIYGDADPAALAFTTSSLGAGTAVNGTLSRVAGENVASYAITQGSVDNASNPNYQITFTPGVTFAINQRLITVTPTAGQFKIYGNADPTLNYQVSGSLVFPDAFTGALTRDPGQNVGSYTITQGTLALSSNYAIAFTNGVTFAINTRPITVTADAKSKTFGSPDPALTFTTSDLGSGIAVAGLLTRDPGENVGPYAITQGGVTNAANPNYAITFTNGILTIQAIGDSQASVVANALGNNNANNQSSNNTSSNQNCSAGGIADQFKQNGSAVIFSGIGMGCGSP